MHLASSAKSNTLANDSAVGKSFIKIRKRTGPRMLPWGTPEITGRVEEDDWPMDTNWKSGKWKACTVGGDSREYLLD